MTTSVMTRDASGRAPEYEVGYITRFLPSYRRAVIAALAQRLQHGLLVGSGQPPGHSTFASLLDDSDDGSLASVVLPNRWIRGEMLYWQVYGPLLNRQPAPRVLLIEESPRTLSLRPLLRLARRRGIKTVLWGHFSSIHRPFDPGNWQDARRLKTARMADALLTYTEDAASRVRKHLPDAAVFTARNTLDTDVLFPLGDALIQEGRSAIRNRLGLPDHPTLLFLGRLIAEKQPQRVVDVASSLARSFGSPVGVVMIGDGPERAAVEEKAKAEDVPLTMTGAISDLSESAPWIAACDALVNPGYLGLSVNHALSLGVPIVAPAPSPGGAGHSQEWVFVQDGINGRFSPDDSIDSLQAAAHDVLEDAPGYQSRSAAYAREELTLDRMVDGLVEAILHVSPETAVMDTP